MSTRRIGLEAIVWITPVEISPDSESTGSITENATARKFTA